jgi:hypothetical protein
MGAFNIFRVAADLSHILSKLTLMWAIHWNRSAEARHPLTTLLATTTDQTRE